jgi:hypothetical protein
LTGVEPLLPRAFGDIGLLPSPVCGLFLKKELFFGARWISFGFNFEELILSQVLKDWPIFNECASF